MIRGTSSSGYFYDPTAKIDFSIMDGQIVSWPQLVPPIELKHDLGKDHNIALGQLSSRFSHMLEQQPDRKPHCVRV